MRRLEESVFDRPWLILCEGDADRVFFNLLIRATGLPLGAFDVKFPGRKDGEVGGRSKFGPYLQNLREVSISFREQVRNILCISDQDEDPVASFEDVRRSLSVCSDWLSVPTVPRVFTRKQTGQNLGILMIPETGPGGLETLCVQAAYRKWQIGDAVETLIRATPARDFGIIKKDKARIHTIIANTCERKPEASVAQHWKEDERFHIPVDDEVFDSLREYFRELAATQGD